MKRNSKSETTRTVTLMNQHQCNICKTSMKSSAGLKNHLRKCKENGSLTDNNVMNEVMDNSQNVIDLRGEITTFSADTNTLTAKKNNENNTLLTNTNIHHHIRGNLTFGDLQQIVSAIYEESSKWKRNLFLLPSGSAGKKFIDECTRMINAWNNNTPLCAVAIKAVMIFPSMMLKKPSKNSKSKEHNKCLQRRLDEWKAGNFDVIVREVRSIQSKLKQQSYPNSIDDRLNLFNNLMLNGNVNAVLKLLSNNNKTTIIFPLNDDTNNNNGGILPLNDDTMILLQEKHPHAGENFEDLLLQGPENIIDKFIFDGINGSMIQKAALHTKGAAGPSNLDAAGWKRILTSKVYGTHNTDLCESIATMTRILCTTRFCCTDNSMEAFFACRLIPLDKNPWSRPIGIGDILRRIIG